MSKTVKCKHKTTRPMWRDGTDGELIQVTRRCADCQAIGVVSLGPANDIDAPINELVAAEVGAAARGVEEKCQLVRG